MDENQTPVVPADDSGTSSEDQQQAPAVNEQEQVEQQVVEGAEQEIADEHVEQRPSRYERRQERYIDRLTEQIMRGQAQGNSYRQELLNSTQGYKPIRYDDAEYDAQELEKDRRAYGDTRYQEGLQVASAAAQQEFFVDRLERDTDYVSSHYRQLDERSDDFNPDLADRVNRLYLATIGYNPQTGQIANPGIRYRDFTAAFMDTAEQVASSQTADTAQNIARQAGRTGMRPSGGSRRSGPDLKNPNAIAEMTQEEYSQNKDAIQQKILQELGM